MTYPSHSISSPSEEYCGTCEEEINLYLDGELPFASQPDLFSRLAACPHCRRHFNAIMLFRRISREERIELPPASEETFYKKLAQRQRYPSRVDRYNDRRPIWETRRSLSVRAVALTVAIAFFFGIRFRDGAIHRFVTNRTISQQVEYVSLDHTTPPLPHYFIFPGLTVEDDSLMDSAPDETIDEIPRTDNSEETYMVP